MVSKGTNSNRLLRIADASLNRMSEGLRYLEDVSRFVLDDRGLNQQLKNLRHQFVVSDWEHQKGLIDARDAGGDVGSSLEVSSDSDIGRGLPESVVANSRRVQEALRSLEEIAKVCQLSAALTPENLQLARFDMYVMEKNILGKLTRHDISKGIYGLYVVIDTQSIPRRSHLNMTRQVIKGGARVIQLRDKKMDRGQLLPIAVQMAALCRENKVLFIINDYVDVALAAGADGVHLGQTDLPVIVARRLVPIDMLIGCSVTTVPEAKRAQADGADYLAVSGVYPTSSKDMITPLGTGLSKRLSKIIALPLVAIGGITLENVPELKACGVDSIAVIHAVLGAKSPVTAARQLSRRFEEK